MNELLILVLLLALAIIVIVFLIVLCWQFQSQAGARSRDLGSAQAQLGARNDDLMKLQYQLGTRTDEIRQLQLQHNIRTDEFKVLQSQLGTRHGEFVEIQNQLGARNDEFIQLQARLNNLAQRQFIEWREREIKTVREELQKTIMEQARNAFHQWQTETEANIRADAIKRSSAVVSGKVTEHLMPYMGIFPYNPKDARFLGAPVDLIVFDGLSEGNLQEIVFLEVKTGASSLNAREKQLRDAIVNKRVAWREFRIST